MCKIIPDDASRLTVTLPPLSTAKGPAAACTLAIAGAVTTDVAGSRPRPFQSKVSVAFVEALVHQVATTTIACEPKSEKTVASVVAGVGGGGLGGRGG